MKEVEERYRKLRPDYEQFVAKLEGLLRDLARDAGVDVSMIEGRAKTVDSFLDKIRRKSYDDPFRDIMDLAGLRVITYYHDDVPRMVELLQREFEVLPGDSADKLEELDVDEFGYRSWHTVVRLSSPRATLPEWKRFVPLQAEVQVRTVLQHSWAAISHKLDYKKAAQAPAELRRKLFRLSALLELADEEFASVRDEAQEISARYDQELRKGDLDLPLDLDSLSQFLAQHVDASKWEQLGRDAGFKDSGAGGEEDDRINLARLLLTVQSAGLESISELAALLEGIGDADARGVLERVREAVQAEEGTLQAVPVDVLTLLVSHEKRERLPPDFDWGGQFKRPIRRALRKTFLPPGEDD